GLECACTPRMHTSFLTEHRSIRGCGELLCYGGERANGALRAAKPPARSNRALTSTTTTSVHIRTLPMSRQLREMVDMFNRSLNATISLDSGSPPSDGSAISGATADSNTLLSENFL